METPLVLFWFRRDLRLSDNAGLYHALASELPVLPIFIFDKDILEELPDKKDLRVAFIHGAITNLHEQLKEAGSTLLVRHGKPLQVLTQLIAQYQIKAVYTNHDYEPYALTRDQEIAGFLQEKNIPFHTFKDQVIFEKDEISKEDNSPYRVYGAYKRKWLATLSDAHLAPFPSETHLSHCLSIAPLKIPTLEELGFASTGETVFPPVQVPETLIKTYDQTRDLPFLAGTTRLAVHLRFGTVSVRALVKQAMALNAVWLGELIWREFFMQILFHFPHVATRPFHLEYEHITWLNQESDFARWCTGTTGYPLVDAGMRELNATGFMHNRVRMVAASFLVKHLLIDYRWGEAYFAEKLLDFDQAANNGNWQWCAGTGVDAAPYFRVFNPETQAKRFDHQKLYVQKWVPEVGTTAYPLPMVEHAYARDRALQAYKSALAFARNK